MIAFHLFALLVDCLLHSYNFIFAFDHRFLVEFRSGVDVGNSIIFIPVNLICSKNLWVSLDTCKGTLLCMNSHFTLKLRYYWDQYHEKKVLSIKSQKLALFSLTSSFTFNGPVIVWSTISTHIFTPPPLCCLLFATDTFALNKNHPLARLSGSSNVTRDYSVKITLEKSFVLQPNFDALKQLI